MSFPRFFIGDCDASGDCVVIKGDSAAHIGYSLRMKSGEKIIVCDGKGKEYLCVLESFSGDEVRATIEDVCTAASESPFSPVVFQACPKGDKADTVVMKSVELGACEIVFFVSSRSIARYGMSELEKKKTRWQRIALESAKQSGRGIVPVITVLPDTAAAAERIKGVTAFLCYEDEKETTLRSAFSLRSSEKSGKIAFIIGPEGGFSESEVSLFVKSGAVSVSLGKRILRTETVSSFVLSCLSYETEL